MVTVVGAPAEGQFGQVSGADHNAVLLIGDVHENLGPLTRLGVLVGGIHHFRVVADVLEMLFHGGHYRNLTSGHTENLHQIHGVGFGAMCRAKTWHGDADDILSRESKLVEGHDRHQKSQRAVEAAGYSQNSLLAACVLQTGDESGSLNLQDLL